MTDLCATHRPYLAALADGELDLVPAATRRHVETCEGCGAELEAHQLLGQRLRAAFAGAGAGPAAAAELPQRGSRLVLIPLAAAAAVALAIGGIVFATRPAAPDPLAAAVLVAARSPEYASSDPAEIARWCTAKYGNRVPVVALPGLQPVGARMDWSQDQGVATVTYTLDAETVKVSWLTASEGSAEPRVVNVGGTTAVLVRKDGMTALISGSATQAELLHVAQEVAAVL